MIISDKDLLKIESLAERAEDGPWWQDGDTGFITNKEETEIAECRYCSTADYIAAVNPEVGLSLIREIRRSRAEIKNLNKQLDFLAKQCPLDGTENWQDSIERWRKRAQEICKDD